MVAPAFIAGLGVIASGLANVILGAKGPVYGVVRFAKGEVIGKFFGSDINKAEAWQEQLSRSGHGSIIIQKVHGKAAHGGVYTSLHPVQAMAPVRMMRRGIKGIGQVFTVAPPGYWLVKWRAPGSMKEHLEVFQWEREAKERVRDLDQMAAWASFSMIPRTKHTQAAPAPKKLGSYKPPLDTKDQQESAVLLTTRFPVPERFDRARMGPFPETAIYNDDKLVDVPLFDDTVSSHMWQSDVVPMKLPEMDFEKGVGYKQPELMVVEQALQYPE